MKILGTKVIRATDIPKKHLSKMQEIILDTLKTHRTWIINGMTHGQKVGMYHSKRLLDPKGNIELRYMSKEKVTICGIRGKYVA